MTHKTVKVSDDRLTRRVQGLDTLQFVLAMWVVFGHFGFVPIAVEKSNFIGKIIVGINNNRLFRE